MIKSERLSLVVLSAILAALLAGVAYFKFKGVASEWVSFVVNEETHPALFVVLFVILPVIGFPASLFFVLAGVKFGIWPGIFLSLACIPVHMSVSYILAARLFRRGITAVLNNRGYSLYRVPRDRRFSYTFLAAVCPGPPYALKNYLLPLGGVPYGCFMGVAGPVHLAAAVPLVGLGGSVARLDYKVVAVFLMLLVAGYLVVRWIRKKAARLEEELHGESPGDGAGKEQ